MEAYEKYKVGDSLELKAIEMGKDNDYLILDSGDYLILNNKDYQPRVYTRPFKFDEDNLPFYVPVLVSKIDVFERICLRLDRDKLFSEHYKLGEVYRFVVEDIHEDQKTKAPYYIISDDFAEHHYYVAEGTLLIGEEYDFIAKKFTDKGFVAFELMTNSVNKEVKPKQEKKKPIAKPTKSDMPYILDIEGEGTTLELKTSIAFPPGGNGEANIDKQLDNIIRVICAFMNTKGGKLYIGVHDTKKCVEGIADDYEHLNDSTEDENQYNENHDGYELKIRNTIDRKCTSVVNSLIEFSFCQQGNREYCVITVTKAKRPVWFKGTQLWVRQGCRNKQLDNDEITLFVAEYVTISMREKLEYDGIDITHLDNNERTKSLRSMIYTLKNDVELPKPPALGEIDYWINWLEDGSWKRTREKAIDREYCIQVPVPKNVSNPLILFCYESGHVNCMKLSDFRKGSKMNTIVPNKPWNVDNGEPINILIAEPADLLFGFSLDYNGHEHVKFHMLTDFTTSGAAKNQGVKFVPDNNRMIRFCIVGSSYTKQLEHLKRTRQQRSQDAGEPIDSPTFAKEIALLQSLLQNRDTE